MLCGIVMLHRVMCRIYVEFQEKFEMNKNSTTAPLPSTLKLRNMCMHINVNIFFNLELFLIMWEKVHSRVLLNSIIDMVNGMSLLSIEISAEKSF